MFPGFGFIFTILGGIIAGWLAEKIMKVDMPLWQNLLYGLGGSALGSIFLLIVGKVTGKGFAAPGSFIPAILIALVGACLIIFIVGKIKEKKA